MTDRKEPTLDETGLKRLLGVLTPPAPSDLLRARIENAIVSAPVSGSDAGFNGATPGAGVPARALPRPGLYARLAASVLLAAGVALAIWLPGSPRDGGAPVTRQWAAGSAGGNSATVYAAQENAAENAAENAQENGRENAIGLTLVGGGAPVTGIALVRADWSAAPVGVENDSGYAAEGGTDGGVETLSDLEAIPLY
jgi:hypothetical protein